LPGNSLAIQPDFKAGGNRDVTVEELPGLNPLFQSATTGGPNECGAIEETFSPAALQLIGIWIGRHTQK
jgi:hypothetical protein